MGWGDPMNKSTDTVNVTSLTLSDLEGVSKKTPTKPLEISDNDTPPEKVIFIPNDSSILLNCANTALWRYNFKNPSNGVYFDYYTSKLVEIYNVQNDAKEIKLIKEDARISLIVLKEATWYIAKVDSPLERIEPSFQDCKRILAASPSDLKKVPLLKGVYRGVMLTKNGKLIHTAGYDPDTLLYFTKSFDVDSVPEKPTEVDILGARSLLWDIFKEFKFSDMEEGEKSVNFQNTLFCLILAILRPTWEGVFPIAVVKKPSKGAGGSLLQIILGILAYGEIPDQLPSTKRKDELEKKIESKIIEHRRYVIIDNVELGTNWAPEILLCAHSGTGRVSIRKMGGHNDSLYPPETFFCANGINIEIRSDVTRRVIPIFLNPSKAIEDKDWTREKNDLVKLALDKHPDVIRAISLFWQNWKNQQNNKKDQNPLSGVKGNISEYKSLFEVVAGILQGGGYTNFLKNLDQIQNVENTENTEFIELIDSLKGRWKVGTYFTPKDLLIQLLNEGRDRKRDGSIGFMLDAFPEDVVKLAKEGNLSSVKIGCVLSSYLNKKILGYPYFLNKVEKRSNIGFKYFIDEVEKQIQIEETNIA